MDLAAIDLEEIDELCLINYTAVSVLERLRTDLSQERMKILEAMVLMACYPHQVTPATIEQCVGDDKLAALFLYLKNKDFRTKK